VAVLCIVVVASPLAAPCRAFAVTECFVYDCSADGQITIDEIVHLVHDALDGCDPQRGCCFSIRIPTITDILYAIDFAIFGCRTIPTPGLVHYQLTAGSLLISSPDPPSSENVTTEPLTGTIDLSPIQDVHLGYDIVGLELRSQSVTIRNIDIGAGGVARNTFAVSLDVNATGKNDTPFSGLPHDVPIPYLERCLDTDLTAS